MPLAMASGSRNTKKAQEAKLFGDLGYLRGDFADAAKCFQRAIELDPQDTDSVSRLADIRMCQGRYAEGLTLYLQTAQIELAAGNSKRVAVWCVGILRAAILGKDTVHSNEIDKVVSQLSEQVHTVQELHQLLREQRAALFNGSEAKLNRHWQQILDYVPRCRPTLFVPLSLYQPTSEEIATPLITPHMWLAASSVPCQMAFMHGGYVDARHFYKTLNAVWRKEQKGDPKHRYHFTMVGALPHYAARLAVFCYLLMTPLDDSNANEITIVIALAFATSRIPRFAYDRLVNAMKVVRESLLRDGTVVRCPFLWIPASFIPGVVRCLECWSVEQPYQRNLLPFHLDEDSQPHEPDRKLWEAIRVVRIPSFILGSHDPNLVDVINKYEKEEPINPRSKSTLKDLIQKTWIVNPFSWDATVPPNLNELIPDDPPRTAANLAVGQVECVRDDLVLRSLSIFFHCTGEALHDLKDRIFIELITGDTDEVCERMCIRHLPHRASGLVAGRPDLDPAQFPWIFDHISCGTTPVYTGCMLPIMRHCMPLLKNPRESLASATFVHDSLTLRPLDMLVAEFAALKSSEMLHVMAGVDGGHCCDSGLMGNTANHASNDEKLCQAMWWRTRSVPHYPATNKSSLTGQLPQRLTVDTPVLRRRSQFERWMMTLFWRIAAPPAQSGGNDLLNGEIKCMPENITSFVRVLDFAHRHAGFSGQWINVLLRNILSGRPATPVTLPRGPHLTPEEAIGLEESNAAALTFAPTGTSFWAAELSTMLTIWRPVLDWGLLMLEQSEIQMSTPVSAPQPSKPVATKVAGCPNGVLLPPLSAIYRYSAKISKIDRHEVLAAPQNTLVLWDARRLGNAPVPARLFQYALRLEFKGGDKKGNKSSNTQREEEEDDEDEWWKEKSKGKAKKKRKRPNRKKKKREKVKGKGKEEDKMRGDGKREGREHDGGSDSDSGSESDGESGIEKDVRSGDEVRDKSDRKKEHHSGRQGHGGSSGGTGDNAGETPKWSYDKAAGALHVISAFEWQWLDIEERSGVATWWMRADVMDAILHNTDTDACWQLWLCSTSTWKYVNHNVVPAHQIETHGSWEELLNDSCDGDPFPSGNPNRYYHAAPVTKLPSHPLYPTRGSLWFHGDEVQQLMKTVLL